MQMRALWSTGLALAAAASLTLGCRGSREEQGREAGRRAAGTMSTLPAPSAPRPSPTRGGRAFRAPAESDIPAGLLGRSVRRGRALLAATRDSLPGFVGNRLRCTSCHLDGGRRANAIPWVGVYARFPQYRSRNDAVNVLEDRINDCFERSMNGKPLRGDSRDMRDIVAYMAFLSQGVPVGQGVPGQGLPTLTPRAGDSARGAELFAARCTSCHGARGQGTRVAPPLWGPESYTIGAGMARVRTAASFIRHNMPFGNPNLTDQQAFDVATYINSRPRPDFPGKEKDWPRGDAPADVAYQTRAAKAKPRGPATTPRRP